MLVYQRVEQCLKPPFGNGNGKLIPPIKIAMTGNGSWHCFTHVLQRIQHYQNSTESVTDMWFQDVSDLPFSILRWDD